jgi:polyhydroxyalkanoate synthesis regulator phasin
MNPTVITETLQRGFHLSLGAATAFTEGIQDSVKRDATLRRLSSDLPGLTDEWVAKGVTTEREARTFVDQLIAGRSNDYKTVNTTATVVPGNIQADLEALTAQVAALRQELEQLRK